MALTKINASVIANNTIAVGNIADNSVDATKIASNSILTRHIDDNQVTTDQIAANTIATANIADNAVDGTKIASNSILTRHIDDDQVTGDQLADNIDIAGTLDVTGATVLDSTLQVDGAATFSGDVTLASATANKPVLTLTDTNADSQGPDLVFRKDSASPADGDELFRIYGYGDDDGGTATEGFLMLATMTDVTNGTEDSKVQMFTYGAGSQRDTLTLAGLNVGIGTASPSVPLHINSTSAVSNRLAIFESDINNTNEYSTISVGHNQLSANFGLMLTTSDTAYIGVGSSGNVFDPTTGTGLYVNANGNVGIGTTSPLTKFHVHNGSDAENILIVTGADTTTEYISLGTSSGVGVLKSGNSASATNGNPLAFETAASNGAETERMRIDGSGNVGIGITSPSRLLDVQLTATNASLHNNNTAAVHFGSGSGNANSDGYIQGISIGYKTSGANTYAKTAIVARGLNDGAARQSMAFLVDTTADGGSAEIGDAKLTINGTTGVVSGDLNDTSDIAFKENILDLGNTLDLVKQLQPKTFTWKNEKAERGDSVGFIAQDVKSIIPDSTVVQGTAYEKNGDEGYSINTIGLVAYLTKAIQEQQTIIEDLKARIETLEG